MHHVGADAHNQPEHDDNAPGARHPRPLRHREMCPGRFTVVKPAAVELHTTMALLCATPPTVVLTPDTTNAQAFLPEPASLRASVLLADRGSLDLHSLRRLQDAGGFCIIRANAGMNPQVVEACREDGKRLRSLRHKPLKAIHATLPKRQRVELVVAWQVEEHPLRLRLLISWNRQTKECCSLLTNLPAQRSPLDMIYRAYKWRWQVELLLKEWKSYAHLHAFDTENPAIVAGLIWTAIAAAALKRFLAHMTQLLLEVPMSTRKVALCAVHVLGDFSKRISLYQDVETGWIRISQLGNSGWRVQSVFHRPHRPLAQRHPLLVDLPTELDDRVHALPRHTFGPLQHRLHIDQLGPVPVQFQDAPAPLDGIILAVVGRVIQQLNRLANGIAERHHALQKLRAFPTAFRAIIHFDLQPCHGHLLGLIQRRPPGLKRIDDEITRLVGTAKGDVELATIFLHNPTGNVLFFQPQVVITGLVITPREAAAGHITDMHGRFTIDAQPFDMLRLPPLVGLFFTYCRKWHRSRQSSFVVWL